MKLLHIALVGGVAALMLPLVWAAPDPREIQMYSKKLDYDEKRKKVRLIGDVKLTSERYVMTAPYAEFFTDKKIGEFQGGVKITGEGTVATGKRMKVFYPDQRAVLIGDVRLVSQKGPGSTAGSPTVMTGNELEYQWIKGYGVATGSVKVHQSNRRAFADKATYYRDQQMVYLEGNVRVEQGDGDWLTSDRARMNLATRVVEADGGVTARTLLEEKDKAAPAPESPGQARPIPMEPPFPLAIPTTPPPPNLPGVDE
ncbi:LPS export ABC transporter periplasmic protein LptC [bacterium]|nr:LPS export ABC transporter periplasmic protein LptC [bacterium]